MAFTVKYQPHTEITVRDEFGDQAVYDIVEGGVLKIISPDTNGKVSFTPPTVWQSVFADKDHLPGKPRGGGPGKATVVR